VLGHFFIPVSFSFQFRLQCRSPLVVGTLDADSIAMALQQVMQRERNGTLLSISCQIPRKSSDWLTLGHVVIAGPVTMARGSSKKRQLLGERKSIWTQSKMTTTWRRRRRAQRMKVWSRRQVRRDSDHRWRM
jgi:hypothetical protein